MHSSPRSHPPASGGPPPSPQPERADGAMLADVRAGLARAQKELPPKFFYDQRGSELFEEITALPEYYPTRTERALLNQWAPALVAELAPRTLMELGAGSAEKTRIILDAMRAAGEPGTYVPVDVSASFLERTAATLRAEYPGMSVIPVVADITQRLGRLRDVPRPALIAFLGSTIGNLEEHEAVRLLCRVRAAMRPGDHFLLGADLRKDVAVIEAAYNDAAGVTAEFNRNVLRVLNRELGADFDPEAFAHRAFYEPTAHRVEMHLVSTRDQVVQIPGVGRVPFRAGESIRTEISCKYDRATIEGFFAATGLRLARWVTDLKEWFALAVGAAA